MCPHLFTIPGEVDHIEASFLKVIIYPTPHDVRLSAGRPFLGGRNFYVQSETRGSQSPSLLSYSTDKQECYTNSVIIIGRSITYPPSSAW